MIASPRKRKIAEVAKLRVASCVFTCIHHQYFFFARPYEPTSNRELYAAKGGIAALTHALAVSLSGRARVNSISPG